MFSYKKRLTMNIMSLFLVEFKKLKQGYIFSFKCWVPIVGCNFTCKKGAFKKKNTFYILIQMTIFLKAFW